MYLTKKIKQNKKATLKKWEVEKSQMRWSTAALVTGKLKKMHTKEKSRRKRKTTCNDKDERKFETEKSVSVWLTCVDEKIKGKKKKKKEGGNQLVRKKGII